MACFGQQADVKYCRCRRLLQEYKEDIQLDRQGQEMVAVIYSLSKSKRFRNETIPKPFEVYKLKHPYRMRFSLQSLIAEFLQLGIGAVPS